MSTWILQHFLNPAFFWPGMALLAAPIIIHLIHRLRFRRVRFAAMEFLLASQKRNQRRVLLESLLLLLLRIALVLLAVLLIARLIVDPEQISLFQGAKSHHVVILDDSASMLDRDGDQTVFDSAKQIVGRIAAEGARRPGTQLLSLVLMSAPDKTVSGLSERAVDDALLGELTERLESLACTHQAIDPAVALEAVSRRLQEDRAGTRCVHVLSDFRQSNWLENKGALAQLQELDSAEIAVNLVRCQGTSHENLGLARLEGAVEVAAAGVPVTLTATIRNWGERPAENVSGSVFVDGVRLPRTIDFPPIPPGQEVARSFDVVFESAQPHRVSVTIPDDALLADNQRFLAVDVPVENPVLLVDGSPGAEQAQYIRDALAADQSVTGFAPQIASPEDLRHLPLETFPLIYLINVPELAPDAVAALERYVRDGGGLIWYLGDAVRPEFYNQKLFHADEGLFPARLGIAPETVDRTGQSAGPDLTLSRDPAFEFFTGSDVPVLDLVFVNVFYPLAPDEEGRSQLARDVEVLGRVRGEPFLLEHRLGKGQVLTWLSSAGPIATPEGVAWNNWANGPAGFSFAVLQLELAKKMIRREQRFPSLDTGSPIELTLNPAVYQPGIEIIAPNEQVTRLQAATAEQVEDQPAAATLQARFRQTDEPGVYAAILTDRDQAQHRRLFAFNVPASEGALQIIEDSALLQELGPQTAVRIQPAGTFEWIRSESPGSDVRWVLLAAIAIFCILEQALASRLSYHPHSH